MNTDQEGAAKFSRFLRRTEAAKYVTETYGIPCSAKTLAKLACVSLTDRRFAWREELPSIPFRI